MWPFKPIQADDSKKLAQTGNSPSSKHAQVNRLPEQPLIVPNIDLEGHSLRVPTTDTEIISENKLYLSRRLGIDPVLRGSLIAGVSFVTGFALGSAHGSTTAVLRYRAENAHHPPTSKAGWWLYQKSRNYHAIIGGVTEGIKNGARFTGWTALFFAFEEGLDRARGRVLARRGEVERKGQRDILNTLSAAVAMSGIYSRWNNLDRFAAMRLTKSALKLAIPYGLAQDLVASFTDDRPWYVDWIVKKTINQDKRKPEI